MSVRFMKRGEESLDRFERDIQFAIVIQTIVIILAIPV